MEIGIITIGDELLAGLLNTNQSDLSRLVTPLGHRVVFTLVVGDDEKALVLALEAVLGPGPGSGPASAPAPSLPLRPVDMLILTGGLGPTRDDLTRQAVAAYLGEGCAENAEALVWLGEFLGKRAEDLPPGQRVQAAIPGGTVPLRNPLGTACGFAFRAGSARVFGFPGVPKELRAMADLHIAPALAGDRVLLERSAWTWGWSESAQRQSLEGLTWPPALAFSSLPGERGVRIALRTLSRPAERALREAELDAAWRAVLAAVPVECLVDADGLALPAAVFALLKGRGAILSLAESCTGGGLGALLTETPGSSAVFERGFLTYSNQAKIDLLGVPAELLKAQGAVSEAAALAMASGCLERSGADYACAITGIAGPGGGSAEKPVGTVWIAVASPGHRQACRYLFRGDRAAIRQRAGYAALNQIRLFILNTKA